MTTTTATMPKLGERLETQIKPWTVSLKVSAYMGRLLFVAFSSWLDGMGKLGLGMFEGHLAAEALLAIGFWPPVAQNAPTLKDYQSLGLQLPK